MLTITLSHTVTVNPPGAHPVLTLDQLWHTLVVKVRQPQLFVKLILSANVLEEDDDKFVKREVVFHEGMGPPGGKSIENITMTKPWKVDFQNEGPHGAFISNLVSQGAHVTDLYLTFYFEWHFPELEAGSSEAREREETLWGVARGVVGHTVEVAREIVGEGEGKGKGS